MAPIYNIEQKSFVACRYASDSESKLLV